MTRLDLLFPNYPYFQRLHLLDEAPLLEPTRVPVVSGAFMMILRPYFELLDGMDGKFFLHVDDADLCLRVHLQGGEVWYDEKASIQALERAQGYLKLPNGRALTGQSHRDMPTMLLLRVVFLELPRDFLSPKRR
jgi:hypothetical protein